MTSGKLQDDIVNALDAAFPLPGGIERVVDRADLGYGFEEFLAVPGTKKSFALRNLVRQTEAEDKLVRLIKAARETNGNNPHLNAVWQRFDSSEQEFGRLGAEFGEAEKILFGQKPFEDVAVWLDRLAKVRRAVCRVEPQPETDPLTIRGYGSGFLVARDAVMTNFHVVQPFWDDPTAAQRVRVRFDFERAVDVPAVSAGVEVALADRWAVG